MVNKEPQSLLFKRLCYLFVISMEETRIHSFFINLKHIKNRKSFFCHLDWLYTHGCVHRYSKFSAHIHDRNMKENRWIFDTSYQMNYSSFHLVSYRNIVIIEQFKTVKGNSPRDRKCEYVHLFHRWYHKYLFASGSRLNKWNFHL